MDKIVLLKNIKNDDLKAVKKGFSFFALFPELHANFIH